MVGKAEMFSFLVREQRMKNYAAVDRIRALSLVQCGLGAELGEAKEFSCALVKLCTTINSIAL